MSASKTLFRRRQPVSKSASRVLSGQAAAEAAPIHWTPVAPAPDAPREREPQDAPPDADPHRECRQQAEEAYRKGFRDGEAAQAKAGEESLRVRMEQLGRALEALGAYRPRLRHEAEQDVVKLSLMVARRLLHRELQVDGGALLGLVKAALDKLDLDETPRVRLHPDYAEPVRAHLAGVAPRMEVSADAGLPPGALVFETQRGSLDAGLETQLAEIERGFTDLLAK